MSEAKVTCWFLEARCPRCGAQLITNGSHAWCTYAGGTTNGYRFQGCGYGIDERVKLEEVQK